MNKKYFGEYPKKRCDFCDKVVQLHFDIRRVESLRKMRFARCPYCHKALFPKNDSLSSSYL